MDGTYFNVVNKNVIILSTFVALTSRSRQLSQADFSLQLLLFMCPSNQTWKTNPAKVAKCFIIGCVLECVEPSLTIAACLSHSKSIWLPSRSIDKDAREMQKKLVEEGFGGKGWRGGTVKGDLIGAIAAYEKWSAHPKEKDRRKVASKYALDHNVLREVHGLRSQFKDSLVDAAFLDSKSGWDGSHDDALFTSCCLVAGLYPNVRHTHATKEGKREPPWRSSHYQGWRCLQGKLKFLSIRPPLECKRDG